MFPPLRPPRASAAKVSRCCCCLCCQGCRKNSFLAHLAVGRPEETPCQSAVLFSIRRRHFAVKKSARAHTHTLAPLLHSLNGKHTTSPTSSRMRARFFRTNLRKRRSCLFLIVSRFLRQFINSNRT